MGWPSTSYRPTGGVTDATDRRSTRLLRGRSVVAIGLLRVMSSGWHNRPTGIVGRDEKSTTHDAWGSVLARRLPLALGVPATSPCNLAVPQARSADAGGHYRGRRALHRWRDIAQPDFPCGSVLLPRVRWNAWGGSWGCWSSSGWRSVRWQWANEATLARRRRTAQGWRRSPSRSWPDPWTIWGSTPRSSADCRSPRAELDAIGLT